MMGICHSFKEQGFDHLFFRRVKCADVCFDGFRASTMHDNKGFTKKLTKC